MLARTSSGPPCCTSSPLALAASRASSATRGSLLVVAELKRGKPLKKQRERHDPGITVLAAQRQRLGARRSDLEVTSLEVVHVRQTDERPRPQRSRHVNGNRERPFEPELSLLEQAALRPEPEQRAGELDALLGEGRRRQAPIRAPPGRSPARSAVAGAHASLTVAAEDRQCPAELVEEKLEMPLAQPIGGAGLHEPFARILADRLEEAVPALAGDTRCQPPRGTC